MRFGLVLISALVFMGCAQIASKQESGVYFGGEIINPKERLVVLYGQDGIIADTLMLDMDNRFMLRLDNINTGLYSFRHGGEYQMVILEPKDSIMLRLNTNDFDESLVFSGKGARKNNYLLRIFLENEEQDRWLVKYSQKDPEAFLEFVNNRHDKQLKHLDQFLGKKEISAFAQSVLKANIDYNNYADKEIYPFAYFGYNKLVHYKDLPEDFYSHRDSINYDAEVLSEIFAYNRFLFAHIDNLALKYFYDHHEYHSQFDRHEMAYNKAKLDLIDSLFTSELIKNNLLKYKTRDFIGHSLNEEETVEMLSHFKSKCSNPSDIEEMDNLVAAINNLKPGKYFPNLPLVDVYQKEYAINSIIEKPTLIYFWSSNNKMHYRNSHYQVKSLRKKFPEVEFISININEDSDEFWIKTLKQYKFAIDSEYKFKDPKLAKEVLALNFVYKVMVVDGKGRILHPNANIFSETFEDDLEVLLQKKALSI